MRPWLVVSMVALTGSGIATADTLSATREQAVSETRHTVDLEVRDGLAYYKVRRVFHNAGKVADEARLEIDLPYGATATGLRIKGKDRWHEGELMHARKAEELYVELTGLGPSEPKDPALLYWRWTDRLALRVFPIFPGKSNTVEYTLTAPTSYSNGTYHLTYGREPDAKNLVTPVLRLRGTGIAGFDVDGEQSPRTVRLARARLHPALIKHGIENPRVLVRSINVRGEKTWANVTIDVDVRHTWRGDVAISLVSPDGELHSLRAEDLSDGENNLKTSFQLDYDGAPDGTWHLLITDHHPLDGGTLERWSLRASPPGARVFRDHRPAFIPQPTESKAGLATLGVRFRGQSSAVRLGRVALLAEKQFARFEVDVARRLSSLPRPLSVSFVVDVSHTMESEGIEAQLKVIEAYLAHVPWAEFSLTAFGRHGDDLTDGFVPARKFGALRRRLLRGQKLAPRNGSFLDRGLEHAIPGLARRAGSQALVMMTDNRLRPVWSNKAALAKLARLPASSIVHVVEVGSGGVLELRRDDQHRLFPLAKLRGGVAVRLDGILDAKLASLVAEVLYLVRPNRLDNVRVSGFEEADDVLGSDEDSEGPSGVLAEGAGRRWMGSVADAPKAVALTGQLWSKAVRLDGRADSEPFNRATAGFVFSHDLADDLSDTEQFVLAMYARVVSPVTSYLAIEPGVRPSTIGLEGGGTGWGSLGSGSYGTIGHGSGGGPTMSWGPIVDRVKQTCRNLGDGHIDATLALQSHEIADVAIAPRNKNRALERCVVEALWKENIPRSVDHPRDWSKRLRLRFGTGR